MNVFSTVQMNMLVFLGMGIYSHDLINEQILIFSQIQAVLSVNIYIHIHTCKNEFGCIRG